MSVPQSVIEPLPAHLAGFGDGWAAWRWTCVRGAGFPIDLVAPLAAPGCALLAEEALRLTAATRAAWARLIAVVVDAHRTAPDEHRRALSRTLRILRKRRLPAGDLGVANGPALAAAVDEAITAREQAWQALQAAIGAARRHGRRHLREVSSGDAFGRAVLWQNSEAYRCAVLRLPRQDVPETGPSTPTEILVANYLQRYATKNDTIGFFGPKCWARLEPGVRGLTADYGPQLTRRCVVRFESWTIDRVQAAIGVEHDLSGSLTPRRHPLTSTAGVQFDAPARDAPPLSAAEATVLAAADGQRQANELATAVAAEHGDLFASPADVHRTVSGLHDRGLLTLRVELPWAARQDRLLRERLHAVADDTARAVSLSRLDELARARQAVGAASDAPGLDRALSALEDTFRQVTGLETHRDSDQAPRGKGLVYNDCVRDADLTIGEDVLAPCGEAVALILRSARWFTHAVAAAYSREFDELFVRLGGHDAPVNAAELWMLARAVLFDTDRKPLVPVVQELQQRWHSVVPLSPGERSVVRRSADIEPEVRRVFDAPHAGWRYARYAGLDVHLAARGPRALANEPKRYVLGEVHLGNALNAAAFVAVHPAPAELASAMAEDRLGQRVIMLPPRNWRGATGRTTPLLESPGDLRLVVDADVHAAYDARTIPIADCTVRRSGARLVMQIPDGGCAVPLSEAFGTALTHIVYNEFSPFPVDGHRPRLTIDEVVVLRETWRFAASGLMTFFAETDDARRFASVQAWRQHHQLPRWCFVRLSGEGKPIYIDFDSPIFIDLFLARLRRSAARPDALVVVTEMLPAPGEEWLEDHAGRRYTSEIRVVVVDRTPVTS